MVKKILSRMAKGVLWGSAIFLFHGIWWNISDMELFYLLQENFTFHALGFLIFGIVLGGSSVLFDFERFSVLQKTILHAFISVCSWLTIGFVFGWIADAEPAVILSVVLQFVIIYFAFWIASYLREKHQLYEINEALKKRKVDE